MRNKVLTTRGVVLAVLSAMLALCLAFGLMLLPNRAEAANDVSVWTGDLAKAGWGGEGEKPEEYVLNETAKTLEIGSADALAYFAHEVYADEAHALDGVTVKLTCDIDLGGDNNIWIPVGTTERSSNPAIRFSGTFDGQGHTVYNLTSKSFYNNVKYDADFAQAQGYYIDCNGLKVPFNSDKGDYTYGLFGVTANVTVKNLTVSGVTFDFTDFDLNGRHFVADNVGVIIGHNEGSLTVENCVAGGLNEEGTSDSSISVATNGNPAVGGIVGRAYGRKQAGSATETTYENIKVVSSENNVNINYEVIKNDDDKGQYGKVSGILGYATSFKNFEISHCKNYGNINGGQFAGGIIGYFADGSKSTTNDIENNAWNFTIDDCVNYGNITASGLNHEKYGYANGGNPRTYAGGIIAHMGSSTENSASALDPASEYYGRLPKVNLTVNGCVNYGVVRISSNGSNQGYDVAGGIVGMLNCSETGKNAVTNSYNYGNIYGESEQGATYNSVRIGGFIGYQTYYWYNTSSSPARERYVDLTVSGGSSGKVYGDTSNSTNINSLVGSNNYPNKQINAANLVDAGSVIDIITDQTVSLPSVGYNAKNTTYASGDLIIESGVITGLASSDEKNALAITIPANVTEIAAGAFKNVDNLKSVTFAGNQLVTIGDWAFAGTGITEIAIPAGVTSIGTGAFSGCKNLSNVSFVGDKVTQIGQSAFANCTVLNYVKLPANADKITYGSYVFDKNNGENVYLIATNKASYDAILGNVNVGPLLSGYDVTFKITITYSLNNQLLASEDRLYGTDYGVKLSDGKWINQAASAIGPSSVSNMSWYYNSSLIENVDALTALLNDPGTGNDIALYTFSEYGWQFIGRNDIVFDENKEYTTSELNDLLSPSGDKIAKGMTAEIIGYKDAKGVESATGDLPDVIHNAGTYTVRIVIGGNEEAWQDVTIVVRQQTLDLGDYSQLSWIVDGSNAELRDMGLYVYKKNGQEYPSNAILSDIQISALGLDGDSYVSRIVLYSAVRYTGSEIYISVKNNPAFTVEYDGSDHPYAKEVGKYAATAYLTVSNNYTVVNSSASSFRGMTITEGENGVLEVTKLWYVVNTSNYLVKANGEDYGISGFIYGNNPTANANDLIPQLAYRNDDPTHALTFNLDLWYNGVKIGNTFAPGEIGDYINSTMPAGEYTLVATVGDVYSYNDDIDPDGEEERTLVLHAGFTESHSFTVTKKGLQYLNAFNTALCEKTFTYAWDDGKSHFYEQSEEVVNAYNSFVDKFFNPAKKGIWVNYPQYYGNPVVEFNLDSMHSAEYYGRDLVNTGDAETYKVYYKVTALNYFDTLEGLSAGDLRTNYYFTVINVREIALPSVAHQTYNGSALKAVVDIPKDVDGEPLYYTVLTNEGGTDAGAYDVVLKLIDPEHYMWAGQTVNTKTENYTVKFEIDKSPDNYFTTTLGITTWVTGKYGELEEFPVVVDACYGNVVVKLAYASDLENVIYEGVNGSEEFAAVLSGLKAGSYILTATVADSDNYNGILNVITFSVFEKDGLPWWAVLLIVVGALGVAALILWILHEKGVLQMLTGKVIIAMRTKATVDATIAAVRANKVAAEAKKTVAKAEAKDRLEALRAAQAEAKNMSAEEQAAALEEKAAAAAKSAERMQKRANAMQKRADRIKKKSEKQTAQAEAEQTVTSDQEIPEQEIPEQEVPEQNIPEQAPVNEADAQNDEQSEADLNEQPTDEN